MSRSIDQLCHQMLLANVIVPRFETFVDVFEFLSHYEDATAMLNDDQKKRLLAKSFTPGRWKAWFEYALEPIISSDNSWSSIKRRIIDRFSDLEDRDYHFVKLRDLKYDPAIHSRLVDFAEEIVYSYRKAYRGNSFREEDCLRFVKASIPSNLRPALSMITDYQFARSIDSQLKAIKLFDTPGLNHTSVKLDDQISNLDPQTSIEQLISLIRRESQATQRAIATATHKSRSDPKSALHRY